MEKIKLLLYCTKSKPYLVKEAFKGYMATNNLGVLEEEKERFILNGKIVAECDFEVEEIECRISIGKNGIHDEYTTKSLGENELLFASKIDEIAFINYLKGKNGYAIHIKNLHTFDKPRELNYYHNALHLICLLENAPQNMCYCYEYKGMKRNDGEYEDIFEKKIIISIRPEWLCKILNGEKTIEVRKKVLKEMIFMRSCS